jgi:hypothetical protein
MNSRCPTGWPGPIMHLYGDRFTQDMRMSVRWYIVIKGLGKNRCNVYDYPDDIGKYTKIFTTF